MRNENFYSHTLSLPTCLLFLFDELVVSFQIFEHLEKNALKEASFPFQKGSLFFNELQKFFLFSQENPFEPKTSSLDKLCFYSEILLQASKEDKEEILIDLEEMRNFVLFHKTAFAKWKKEPKSSELLFNAKVSFLDQMRKKLKELFKHLIPFFDAFKTDENLLLFFLEKRELFNRFLGPKTIEDLLEAFFPDGIESLKAALFEGFAHRRFEPFWEKKKHLLDRLEWETPCHPQAHSL